MSNLREIETYADLLSRLSLMTPEELAQPVQIVPPGLDDLKALLPAIAIGTVAEMEFDATRTSFDNTDRPEQIVILTDGNPFGEDGAIAEDLETGERIFPQADLAAQYDETVASCAADAAKDDARALRIIAAGEAKRRREQARADAEVEAAWTQIGRDLSPVVAVIVGLLLVVLLAWKG